MKREGEPRRASIQDDPISGIGFASVMLKNHTILLGETKYYQAREDSNNVNQLIIEERSTPTAMTGSRWIVDSTVWASDPISVVRTTDSSAFLAGVYWEKKYPVWQSVRTDGVTRDSLLSMAGLPSGLIRLVGRFWAPDSIHSVRLNATTAGRSGSILISVRKPSRLGTVNRVGRDVRGNSFSVDSLCVVLGGKNGVPPQMIKGQMERESSFNPAYRYEPYTTQFQPSTVALVSNGWFRVSISPSSMGSGAVVPDSTSHPHAWPFQYPTTPQTVWQMVDRYSELVTLKATANETRYGNRISVGDSMGMMTFKYAVIQKLYDPILAYFMKRYDIVDTIRSDDTLHIARGEARDSLVTFLKARWHGGLDSVPAQTRVASSYGLLQPLYETAIAIGYESNPDSIPENLNDHQRTINYSLSHQRRLLNQSLNDPQNGTSINSTSNWPAGYEETWRMTYHGWNPYQKEKLPNFRRKIPVYGACIVRNSTRYRIQP